MLIIIFLLIIISKYVAHCFLSRILMLYSDSQVKAQLFLISGHLFYNVETIVIIFVFWSENLFISRSSCNKMLHFEVLTQLFSFSGHLLVKSKQLFLFPYFHFRYISGSDTICRGKKGTGGVHCSKSKTSITNINTSIFCWCFFLQFMKLVFSQNQVIGFTANV